ncbi:MAG: hypothetical protein E7673_01830 [Ruminococcaceae bacterium]|nr:hypothetical protein [Oscillospiraceae bacterium]
MKRRIISTLLIIATLVLTLVSCGYNFAKEDMNDNAKFADGMSAEAFKAALLSLTVEDADYSHDEATRKNKVSDYAYKILEGLVKTTDTKLQLKEGVLDENDIVYYAYIASYVKAEGEDPTVIYPSKMSGAPASIKLGYSNETTTSKKDQAIRDAIIAAIKADTDGFEFADYAYKTTSDKTKDIYNYVNDDADKSVVVFITYTTSQLNAETNKTETKTYKNQQLVLDFTSEDFLVKTLLSYETKDGDNVGNYKLNTKIDKLVDENVNKITMTKPEGEDADLTDYNNHVAEMSKDDITYTDITVHFAIESDLSKCIEVKYADEKDISGVDIVDGANVTVKAETEVTYYIYPVYFFDVEDLTAENILSVEALTSTTNLPSDSKLNDYLESVNKKEEGKDKSLVELYREAAKNYTTTKAALETAKTALEAAKKALDEAQADFDEAVEKAIEEEKGKLTSDEDKNAINKDSEAVKNNALYKAAEKVLTEKTDAHKKAEEDHTKADKDFNGVPAEGDTVAIPSAEEKKTTALTNLLAKLGEDGAKKIVEKYNESVHDKLVESYEDEMTTHIGQAIWKLIEEKIVITNLPKKAVKEAYERIYEGHEYTFYTGNHSASSSTNYKYYNGDFEQYLIIQTVGAGKTLAEAEKQIQKEAEEHVAEIVKIHFIAQALDMELTKAEIKEAKGTGSVAKDSAKRLGEMNIIAAAQADKLFDYFLEVEMTTGEDGVEEVKKTDEGAKIYKNVKVTTWTKD